MMQWLRQCTRWLPRGLRVWGKRLVYGRLPGVRGAFPYFGEKVFFPPNSYLFERVCDEGVFEGPLLSALIALVRPETVYFDIGANIGLMSVPVLASVKDCRVVSFEPSQNSLPFLRRTWGVSPHQGRWTIIGKAVADHAGKATFSLGTERDSAFEGFLDTGRKPETTRVAVEVTTVDDVWQELGCPRVSVIKSDTEGAETKVLLGAQKCIAECAPAIFIEWNALNLKPYGGRLENLVSLARELGLSIYSLPNLVRIENAEILTLEARYTENFLLLRAND